MSRHLPAVRITGLTGLPEVQAGDDLAALTVDAIDRAGLTVEAGDVFVYTQKIVSKAEDRLVRLDTVTASPLARAWGQAWGKDPRVIELVLQDTVRIVRMDRGVLIAETSHGLVCANAGVDISNVRPGWAARLPADPDGTAERLCAALRALWQQSIGVIISDTFGRPWREGQTNVAIGAAGLRPIVDHRGSTDTHGQPLRTTAIAIADELAAAAELVMGKTREVPIAVIQGTRFCVTDAGGGAASDLLRRRDEDLFR